MTHDSSPSTRAKVDVMEVLRSYGWEGGPEFEKRYYTDPWVFNLVNIIEREREEVERLRNALNEVRDVAQLGAFDSTDAIRLAVMAYADRFLKGVDRV